MRFHDEAGSRKKMIEPGAAQPIVQLAFLFSKQASFAACTHIKSGKPVLHTDICLTIQEVLSAKFSWM